MRAFGLMCTSRHLPMALTRRSLRPLVVNLPMQRQALALAPFVPATVVADMLSPIACALGHAAPHRRRMLLPMLRNVWAARRRKHHSRHRARICGCRHMALHFLPNDSGTRRPPPSARWNISTLDVRGIGIDNISTSISSVHCLASIHRPWALGFAEDANALVVAVRSLGGGPPRPC